MYFLLILAVPVLSLELTEFDDFDIIFDSKCGEFFLFNGSNQFAYLQRHNKNIEFWVTEGANYAVYSIQAESNLDAKLRFTWIGHRVNHRTMDLIMYDGNITYPLKFETEVYMCQVIGLTAGDFRLGVEQPYSLSYKCDPTDKWFIIIGTLLFLIFVLIVIAVQSNGGFKEIIFGPAFSWFLQRSEEIFSRSENNLSGRYQRPGATSSV